MADIITNLFSHLPPKDRTALRLASYQINEIGTKAENELLWRRKLNEKLGFEVTELEDESW